MKATVLWLLGLSLTSGCVAEIQEERLVGPPRTMAASKSETTEERWPDADGNLVCRDVTITYPIVRDVTIRRRLADGAQAQNVALAALLGAGIALLAYGTDQSACSAKTGACPDFATATAAETALLALAAVPLTFIAYNAVRAQDGQTFEYVRPEWTTGASRPCTR